MSKQTPILLLNRRLADLSERLEIAAEESDRDTERRLHREALLLEAAIATTPAETINDASLKLGLLLDHSPCGGIREEVQMHHIQAIGTVIAFLLKVDGTVSEWGAKCLHMDAVATHPAPRGEGLQ